MVASAGNIPSCNQQVGWIELVLPTGEEPQDTVQFSSLIWFSFHFVGDIFLLIWDEFFREKKH
jgi:hypothetical protein